MATGTIVGKGLYLEFVPATDPTSTKVMQVLFTPEGFDEKGVYTQFSMHSRTISETSPRKQWRITKCGTENQTLLSGTDPIGQVKAQELAVQMVERFDKSLQKAVMPDPKNPTWKLRGKPIAVEITSFDLLEVSEWKTPLPALRRIQKCRVALDFPEKLV
jgi:hypothetical protein